VLKIQEKAKKEGDREISPRQNSQMIVQQGITKISAFAYIYIGAMFN
jgi:hypothetical protein